MPTVFGKRLVNWRMKPHVQSGVADRKLSYGRTYLCESGKIAVPIRRTRAAIAVQAKSPFSPRDLFHEGVEGHDGMDAGGRAAQGAVAEDEDDHN
jgi:hypothetical protein